MPRVTIPPKLAKFGKAKRNKVAIGGRGSGKSMSLVDLSVMEVAVHGHKFGCFREFQNSIEDSIHPLIEAEIERLQAPGFTVYNRTIEHENGGGFRFSGLARNPESIKSMYGFNRFFVEEAQTISHKSLRLLTPTLREAGSEIWWAANPGSRADPFSQRFIIPFEKQLDREGFYEDDDHLIVILNYCDNPWFPKVLEQERLGDKERLSTAEYEHVWLGKYNDTVENAIIPVDWFDAAIDAHVKLGFEPRGKRVVSHDPSDEGPDAKGLAFRRGSVVLDILEMDSGDVNEGCDWATEYALANQADLFVWDGDGMGISLKRQVADSLQGTHTDFEVFKGSSGVDRPDEVYQGSQVRDIRKDKTNKQTFKNKRAQYYWTLRDRFYATYRAVVKGEYIDPDELISLSSSIERLDELRSEVCRIPKKPNGSGLIQIMTKDEMAKLEIPSPNMADALMMSMVYPREVESFGYAEASSAGGWMG